MLPSTIHRRQVITKIEPFYSTCKMLQHQLTRQWLYKSDAPFHKPWSHFENDSPSKPWRLKSIFLYLTACCLALVWLYSFCLRLPVLLSSSLKDGGNSNSMETRIANHYFKIRAVNPFRFIRYLHDLCSIRALFIRCINY